MVSRSFRTGPKPRGSVCRFDAKTGNRPECGYFSELVEKENLDLGFMPDSSWERGGAFSPTASGTAAANAY